MSNDKDALYHTQTENCVNWCEKIYLYLIIIIIIMAIFKRLYLKALSALQDHEGGEGTG